MKILGICGSPRKVNTYYMVKTVLEAGGGDNELISLADLNISQCRDCKECHKSFVCVQNDDMQELHRKMKEADYIVLGSPTYFDNVSGLMKTFMDRCVPFYFSEKLKEKKVILLSVGNMKEYLEFDSEGKSKWAEEEEMSVLRCLEALENFSKIVGFEVIGKLGVTQSNPRARRNELVELGRRIVKVD